MKRKIFVLTPLIFFLLSGINLLFAWGVWGHKHINRAAIFALPAGMRMFYYNHIDFITEGAVVPDLRRGLLNDKNESPRHYIDMEDFGNMPVAAFPQTSREAYEKYDSSFLNKTGYLPWYIQSITEKLTRAFTKRNKSEILFLSAELGHYLGDAHMPLHTASNYDGQLTNQKGVHALWESQLPELYGKTYNFYTGNAEYIKDITAETWRIIAHTHSLEDSIFSADKRTGKTFSRETMYQKDAAGNLVLSYNQPVFSEAYAKKFNTELGNMVENQLRLSIRDVANFWYTAWKNAGSPDLLALDDPHLTRQNQKNYRMEYKAWTRGQLLDLSEEKE